MISFLTYYNLNSQILLEDYSNQLGKELKSIATQNKGQRQTLKDCIVSYLRHSALSPDQKQNCEIFIRAVFSPELSELLTLEDMTSLNTSLRVLQIEEPELRSRLEKTVDQIRENDETTISKFQQEVYDVIK